MDVFTFFQTNEPHRTEPATGIDTGIKRNRSYYRDLSRPGSVDPRALELPKAPPRKKEAA